MMNASFIGKDFYPAIYRMPMDKPFELQSLYEDILKDVSVSGIHQKLAQYVTETIEPIGWRAVWRSTDKSSSLDFQCDFEVDVVDVNHSALDAMVIVRRLLSPACDSMTTHQFDEVEHVMKQGPIGNVPLIELYVISEGDSEQQFCRTAVVIEHVRFFMRHIWRAWDGVTGNISPANDIFIEGRLSPRLNLYFDIQNKLIAESTVNKIKKLLQESWQVRDNLDNLAKTMETLPESERDDDDKSFLDEADVYEGMKLRVRLEDIDREMKMLEDPYMRIVASTMSRTYIKDDNGATSEQPTFHVLSITYTLKELKMVTARLEASECVETPVVFHRCLEKALQLCRSGDKVYILPGTYTCNSLPWIEVDIEIIGLSGNRDDVVLQSSDSVGDIFMNCSSNAILMSNVTLRTSAAETHCIMMVHTGMTNLTNCLLDGGKCARNSIIALSKAEVALDGCQIIHEGSDKGILKKPGCGNVTLDGQDVFDQQRMDMSSAESDEDNNSVKPRDVGHSGDSTTSDRMNGKPPAT